MQRGGAGHVRIEFKVKELRALTPEEFARAAAWLTNPPRGSKTEAARQYGVDLSLLIEQLRLTPEERLRKLQAMGTAFEQMRGIARRQ